MNESKQANLQYIFADQAVKTRITTEWSQIVGAHMHVDDGFSIVVMDGEEPVGVISAYYKQFPFVLTEVKEAYIDIIDVKPDYRRKGVARQLIAMTLDEAKKHDCYQVRAWSSDDKLEAIPMWNALGFAMFPATIHPRGMEVNGFYVAKVL